MFSDNFKNTPAIKAENVCTAATVRALEIMHSILIIHMQTVNVLISEIFKITS